MKQADTDEFVEFVRVSSPGLLRTAWLLCGDPFHAEEMVQESLISDGEIRDAATPR